LRRPRAIAGRTACGVDWTYTAPDSLLLGVYRICYSRGRRSKILGMKIALVGVVLAALAVPAWGQFNPAAIRAQHYTSSSGDHQPIRLNRALIIGATTRPATRPTTRPAKVVELKDDAPDAVRTLWTNREAARQAYMKRLQEELAFATKARLPSLVAIRKEMQDVKQAILVITDAGDNDLKVGFIGGMPCIKIAQIVDANSAIVSVHGVYRDATMYVATDDRLEMWISINTDGLKDGDVISPKAVTPIWIDGTKRFSTVLGATRTILHAVPFDIEEYLKRP
jgi:hypothetical protein